MRIHIEADALFEFLVGKEVPIGPKVFPKHTDMRPKIDALYLLFITVISKLYSSVDFSYSRRQ